jgi:hypothetical protein
MWERQSSKDAAYMGDNLQADKSFVSLIATNAQRRLALFYPLCEKLSDRLTRRRGCQSALQLLELRLFEQFQCRFLRFSIEVPPLSIFKREVSGPMVASITSHVDRAFAKLSTMIAMLIAGPPLLTFT